MLEPRDTRLRDLFQAAGHEEPTTDLAARIMARVAVTPMARSTVVKPLIGRWGWIGMGTVAVGLLAVALFAEPGAATPPAPLARLTDLANRMPLPSGDWPIWAIGASACIAVFMLLDRSLSHRLGLR